jgi:hypothetical protein
VRNKKALKPLWISGLGRCLDSVYPTAVFPKSAEGGLKNQPKNPYTARTIGNHSGRRIDFSFKGRSGEIRTGTPYKIAAASDGSPSAA